MTATTEHVSAAGSVPPLSKPERVLLGVVAAAAGGVGGLGLASSFEAVSRAGARWGFASPWMLPVGIDTAIPVFTAAFLLLIRTDMPLGWVRFVPWFLTGVTCWLNVAAGASLSAKVAHGTMPLLWVVLSEVAAHVYASRIGAVTGRRMEKIRRSRWLLAPVSTFALWRRMTLWEITSYADALARERERQLARADLREQHGWRWRTSTPRRERVLLKLGELAPTGTEPEPRPESEAAVPSPPVAKPTGRKRGAKVPVKAKPGRRSVDDVLADARTLTESWPLAELTADRIRQAVNCGAAHARTVRDTLRAERSGATGEAGAVAA